MRLTLAIALILAACDAADSGSPSDTPDESSDTDARDTGSWSDTASWTPVASDVGGCSAASTKGWSGDEPVPGTYAIEMRLCLGPTGSVEAELDYYRLGPAQPPEGPTRACGTSYALTPVLWQVLGDDGLGLAFDPDPLPVGGEVGCMTAPDRFLDIWYVHPSMVVGSHTYQGEGPRLTVWEREELPSGHIFVRAGAYLTDAP